MSFKASTLDSIPQGEVNPMPPIMFDMGEAIRRLKEGRLVTRKGWNGKGMYVFLVPGEGRMLPYLCMSTVSGNLVPWMISQTDALAMDWYEVVVDDASHPSSI